TGRELFAYAPKPVMSRFPSLIAFPPPVPQYFVDGSVATGDVFVDTGDGSRTWKSVVVGGLRQGGNHYYALDVTQPDLVDAATGVRGTGAADRDKSPDCYD